MERSKMMMMMLNILDIMMRIKFSDKRTKHYKSFKIFFKITVLTHPVGK